MGGRGGEREVSKVRRRIRERERGKEERRMRKRDKIDVNIPINKSCRQK